MAKIDTTSGTLAYNRLDMQVSQSLLFAIELYDSLDYLIILDHYDDITIFDDQQNCTTVSYYQLKMKEKAVTIHTVLEEEWLTKLYEHLNEPNKIIRELGLITNQFITAQLKIDKNGKTLTETKKVLSSDRTRFDNINTETKRKICEDIAKRKEINPEDVDLSKFIYLKTILTIESHRDLAEKALTDFLHEKHPKMALAVAKTIYRSLFEIISKKQTREIGATASFDIVKAHKSFSKREIDKIIDITSIIEIPSFSSISANNRIPNEYLSKAALAYTCILEDSNKNDAVFNRTFDTLRKIIQKIHFTMEESLWDFSGRCFEEYAKENTRNIHVLSADLYINVLALCILVKGSA